MRARNASISGYEQVHAWMVYAFENGIHEFTSPTYTWVQFEGMYNGFMWMKDDGVRTKLRASLDHIWAQLSANFFRGDMAQQLSGPHSRDYDTLFGKGGTYTHLFMQGLVDWPYECEDDDLHCEVWVQILRHRRGLHSRGQSGRVGPANVVCWPTPCSRGRGLAARLRACARCNCAGGRQLPNCPIAVWKPHE